MRLTAGTKFGLAQNQHGAHEPGNDDNELNLRAAVFCGALGLRLVPHGCSPIQPYSPSPLAPQ